MASVFRVLEVTADGPAVVSDGTGRVAPPDEGTIRWIDLQAQEDEGLALLRERFGFHPLEIEDCAHFDQRAKLEEYGDHLFLVIHGLAWPAGNGAPEVEAAELHAFLGARLLVTVHAEPIAGLEAIWRRVAGDAALARRGPDFLYYLVADALVDAAFPLLDRVSDTLDEIEEGVLGRPGAGDLARIFALKRALTTIRHYLSPQRDVFAMLARRGDPRVGERTSVYFRDVYDHLVRIAESADAARDLLGNALDAYLSSVANRTNEVMKRLTILSAIFLPLTFLTGFFGQNFTALIPFESPLWFGAVVGACVLVPVAMIAWFRRSGWL